MVRTGVSAAVLLLAGWTVHGSVQAQAWHVVPAVKATATASSNVGLQASGAATMDTVLTVTPQVQLLGTSPDYRLTGTLAADMVQYLGRSRADRVLPRGQVVLNSRLVDRLFFVDAELGADTTSSTPFDLLSDGATFYNVGTVTRERISPYLDRELSPSSRITARSDLVLTQGRGTVAAAAAALNNNADALVQTHTARYDLKPEPAGLRGEVNYQNTRYNDSTAGGLTLQTARLSALYALDPTLTLGVTGGRDAARYTTNDVSEMLRGVSLRWAPTERTLLDALIEKRFFGNGWTVNFTHRSPFMAVSAGLVRQATTYAARLGVLQAGGDVATLVDSILQTRIQDPALRQIAVQDLIAKRGLPNTLTGPVDLFSRTVQLQQGANVTLAMLGVRHTVTFRLFQTRTEDLRGPTEDSVIGLASDATQRGATLGVSRRLTPETTADLTFTHTKTDGLGPNVALHSSNSIVRLGATHSLSPRTTLSGAVRHQTGSSTLIGVNATESAVSVGMLHRF
ncbi:TIGR03016 family PEP-CTERM system-associated outer membrane protein [Sphaerotilus sp.]|uniref:TIGR03016 family PEP-CTERM system-associated outer membrane protein n=1 Tax=Sphaerotilus sp. TaxID=2093942 RepID=UPI0034E2EC57